MKKLPKRFMNIIEVFLCRKGAPLFELKNLAEDLGVKNILVKDESYRFGLGLQGFRLGSYARKGSCSKSWEKIYRTFLMKN